MNNFSINYFFWKFRKLWGRWKWPLNILMTKVLLLVMMLWKCALFPRVACLSGIVQSLGCKPGLSWVYNGRYSQIIAKRKYDNVFMSNYSIQCKESLVKQIDWICNYTQLHTGLKLRNQHWKTWLLTNEIYTTHNNLYDYAERTKQICLDLSGLCH